MDASSWLDYGLSNGLEEYKWLLASEAGCVLDENGDLEWRNANGHLHREDGPAKILVNKTQLWYKHGHLHREDGPAVEYSDGSFEWILDGEHHRDDGPAVEYRVSTCRVDIAGVHRMVVRQWYKHGDLHREDGPAVENADGSVEYWLNGERLTEEPRSK